MDGYHMYAIAAAILGGFSTDGGKGSVIGAVLSLFIFGIVLGPLAIWQASKAEKMGRSATPGKILGWIDTILGIGQILLFLAVFGTFFAIGSGY